MRQLNASNYSLCKSSPKCLDGLKVNFTLTHSTLHYLGWYFSQHKDWHIILVGVKWMSWTCNVKVVQLTDASWVTIVSICTLIAVVATELRSAYAASRTHRTAPTGLGITRTSYTHTNTHTKKTFIFSYKNHIIYVYQTRKVCKNSTSGNERLVMRLLIG